MPTYTRLPGREAEIMGKLRDKPRLAGLHVTHGIYCNIKAWAESRLAAIGEEIQHSDGTLLRFHRGNWREAVMTQGGMTQMQTISAVDVGESVGTVDLWRGFVVETKSTDYSINKHPSELEHYELQLGAYIARASTTTRTTVKGELWIIHESGDHGKMRCPEHGVPEEEKKHKHPETNRPRLICPECLVLTGEVRFLDKGNREPTLRCWEVRYDREWLDSWDKMLAARLQELKADILDSQYQIGGPLPPQRWGYDWECASCAAKERIGCPGREDTDQMEAEMKGSLTALEGVPA